MAINIQDGFNVQTNKPVDARFVFSDLTARNALDPLLRYEGLKSYVVSEGIAYRLVGGIANANWIEDGGSGGGGGSRLNFFTDPSFEKGNTEFTTTGTVTKSVDTTQAVITPLNKQCGKFDMTTAGENRFTKTIDARFTGSRIVFEGFIKTAAAVTINVGDKSITIPGTNVWRYFSVEREVLNAETSVAAYITNAAAAVFYLDEMYFGPVYKQTEGPRVFMNASVANNGTVTGLNFAADYTIWLTTVSGNSPSSLNAANPIDCSKLKKGNRITIWGSSDLAYISYDPGMIQGSTSGNLAKGDNVTFEWDGTYLWPVKGG